VYQLTRERTAWNREKAALLTTTEVSYGITDMTRMQANARELLRLTRDHWGIENRLHWVRDEGFGEDRCRIRTGSAPQVLAAVRNALISALRLDAVDNLAATLRNFGRQSQRALAWLGILKE
jgi:predicted transposase YbfD/YdcC